MSKTGRENFNFKILEKTGNVMVLKVMIANEEQHSFYRNKSFFIPALWSAIEEYKELKSKPFFKLISTHKRANDFKWIFKNARDFIPKDELLSTKNFPLIHDYRNCSDQEWNEIWDNKIDLPIAIYRLTYANENMIEGFEVGMDWDAGVIDPFAPSEQLPLK